MSECNAVTEFCPILVDEMCRAKQVGGSTALDLIMMAVQVHCNTVQCSGQLETAYVGQACDECGCQDD